MADPAVLRREARLKADQKARKEKEKRVLDDQIARLRRVKDALDREKKAIRGYKDAVRFKDDPEGWKGKNRDRYLEYVRNDFRSYYDSYYNKVDDLLDAVIRKIAELENRSSDLSGTIGWLTRAINKLWADIRTALN
jgi:hypothetical protein